MSPLAWFWLGVFNAVSARVFWTQGRRFWAGACAVCAVVDLVMAVTVK